MRAVRPFLSPVPLRHHNDVTSLELDVLLQAVAIRYVVIAELIYRSLSPLFTEYPHAIPLCKGIEPAGHGQGL